MKHCKVSSANHQTSGAKVSGFRYQVSGKKNQKLKPETSSAGKVIEL
jgi:hypothetical protein